MIDFNNLFLTMVNSTLILGAISTTVATFITMMYVNNLDGEGSIQIPKCSLFYNITSVILFLISPVLVISLHLSGACHITLAIKAFLSIFSLGILLLLSNIILIVLNNED